MFEPEHTLLEEIDDPAGRSDQHVDAFRQAVAGERWVRKLVDLCRKDTTEQALVRSTVMQLISNWAD
ncbi:MAG: hypothetical protein ACPGJE_09985, partial [Wenzhouxiangellaceae bacterium]